MSIRVFFFFFKKQTTMLNME